MGNCLASHHRPLKSGRDFDYFDEEEAANKELRDPFSIEKPLDATETTASDATAPLSPLSPPIISAVRQFPSPVYSESVATGEYDGYFLSLAKEADDVLSPLGSSPRRQSRAMQARLQKARNMQLALSGSNDNSHSNGNSNHRRSHMRRNSSSRSLSSRSASESIASEITEAAQDTTPKTAVYAESQLDSAVLCITMSRVNYISPPLSTPKPLIIAVGTESGTVTLQEILKVDEVALSLPNDPAAEIFIENSPAKLGKPFSVHFDTKCRSIDFSPDLHHIAIGGDDGKCRIYRLIYRNNVLVALDRVVELERVDRVYAVQFSPDNRYLAVAGFDGTVAIFNASDISRKVNLVEAIAEIPRDGLILTIDWSPDSRYLAIGGSDKCCAIVDCHKSWSTFHEIRRCSTVHSVKWHPSGRLLAIGATDTVAFVINNISFTPSNEIQFRREGHHLSCKTNAMCWSPNGGYFVVCGSDKICRMYETRKFELVHEIPWSRNITSVYWSQQSSSRSDGFLPRRFLVIGGEDSKVTLMQAGLEPSLSSNVSIVGGDDLSSAASSSYFSNRGDWVLRDDVFNDVEEIKEISMSSAATETCEALARQNTDDTAVLTVAFSQGNKARPSAYFAHSTNDGLVTVRNGNNWKVVAEIQFPRAVRTMAFSYGSKYVAFGCEDSNVYVSDTTSNWELLSKIEFAAPISTLNFNGKNNDRLAVGSVDGTFAFLDPLKGFDFSGEIEGSDSAVIAADWQSKFLAVGREDGCISIFETEQVIKDLYDSVADLSRNAPVRSLSFGVSSRFLAVGDAGGLISIYSSKGGWNLCHQVQLTHSVASLLWCPLGRHLAYASDNGCTNVVDTIFWAEVKEANASIFPSIEKKIIHSTLAFSQDGKMLAFGRSDIGMGVMDSTRNWTLSLNRLNDLPHQKQTNYLTDASSISSREDNGNSRYYEV
jgi:WD40 repeat protein